MHDHPKGASDDRVRLAPIDEDVRDQSAVLREVLLLNPELTTLDELVRELTAGSRDLLDHDRIQRAVRDLIGGGLLLLRDGDLVLPTRAAVHFHCLYEV
ncbi:MAG: hypothetical protein ACTHK6_06085 [Solirubrobacterales bacterium]